MTRQCVKLQNENSKPSLSRVETLCVTEKGRGRPSKPMTAQRRVHLSLRLTWNEYNKLKEEAKKQNLTTSAFVRRKLFKGKRVKSDDEACC